MSCSQGSLWGLGVGYMTLSDHSHYFSPVRRFYIWYITSQSYTKLHWCQEDQRQNQKMCCFYIPYHTRLPFSRVHLISQWEMYGTISLYHSIPSVLLWCLYIVHTHIMDWLHFSFLLEEILQKKKKNIHCDIFLYRWRGYSAVYSMSVRIGDGGVLYKKPTWGNQCTGCSNRNPSAYRELLRKGNGSSSQYLKHMSL